MTITDLNDKQYAVTFDRRFVTITGSLEAAVFLSHVLTLPYRLGDGWCQDNPAECERLTGLNKYAQEQAVKLLVFHGILEERPNWACASDFRVSVDKLMDKLVELIDGSITEAAKPVLVTPADPDNDPPAA